MIRLHQTFGAHTGRVLELDREVIRFGRLPDNEVSFDPHADLDASGRHAELRKENGAWVIIDIGSRNGTLVRGHRVTRQVLTDGDEIEFGIGGPRMRIEIVGAAPGGAPRGHAAPVGGAFATGLATPIGGPLLPQGDVPVTGLPGMSPPSPFAGGALSPAPAPGRVPSQGRLPSLPSPHGASPPSGRGPIMMPQVAPTPEKRYGQRTVGMMIQAAIQEADQRQAKGGNRSTAFIRAVAHEAAQSSSRGVKVALGALSFLLVLTLAAVISLFFYARWQEQQLRDENVRLQEDLAALGSGESAERGRLAERIQRLNDELHQEQEAAGASIAARNDDTVWVLLHTRDNGRREVLCSAFAVRTDLLATNAHCVSALERVMGRGETVRAVPNHGGGGPLVIRQMWRHPSYVAGAPASPDVGLVRVSGTTARQVEIASMSALIGLQTGDDVFVLGFPAVIADNGEPAAGLTTGVVGRLTAFDGTGVEPPMRHLLAHSAFTDEGTAGSPVFDRHGRVVAINAGNIRARRRVVDTGTRVARTVEGDTPYAWAVRADLLLQLLAGLPE